MISPERFLQVVRPQKGKEETTRLATIPAGYAGGRPTVIFDGEEVESTKEYPYLNSYVPAIGDRVLLLRVGHTWVIVGEIV